MKGEIDLMAELDDPCQRGCGRTADECDEAEDGEDCAGSPLVQRLEYEMVKRAKRIDRLQVRIVDLEHELRLARQHLDVCDRWAAVADHDADKARENAT